MDKIIVISPHLDDAIWSLGGWFFHRKYDSEITVINVFSTMGWAYERALPPFVATNIRKLEDYVGLKSAGVKKIINMDYDEAFLRGYTAKDRMFVDDLPIVGEEQTISYLSQKLQVLLGSIEYTMLLFPAGFGAHIDHLLCRVLAHNYSECFFYEEIPYVTREYNRKSAEVFLINKEKIIINLSANDVRMHTKLMKMYVSQIKQSYVTTAIPYLSNNFGIWK